MIESISCEPGERCPWVNFKALWIVITKWKLNWFVVLSGLNHCSGLDARGKALARSKVGDVQFTVSDLRGHNTHTAHSHGFRTGISLPIGNKSVQTLMHTHTLLMRLLQCNLICARASASLSVGSPGLQRSDSTSSASLFHLCVVKKTTKMKTLRR